MEEGANSGANELFSLVYSELRDMAERFFAKERANHTLQPTALVHEAYIRFINQRGVEWEDPVHFKAIAAKAIRQILIDYARRHRAAKRGGNRLQVTLDEEVIVIPRRDVDLIRLDEALEKLSVLDDRQSLVVELRFFGGLTVAEVAEQLRVSKRSIESDWTLARAWLHRELSEE